MPIRPPQEAYRSMPGTPLGMDPRGVNSVDMAAAMEHARSGLEVGDYFLGAPKFPTANMRPRTPMMPFSGHNWDHENGFPAGGPMNNALGFRDHDRERDLDDFIRKENKVAALLNGAIIPPAKYAQVYPLRCEDGSFPSDFKSAKTTAVMKTLDNSQLDRIMQAYRLPIDLPAINTSGHHARDSLSSTRVRQGKLYNLLEFLGAYHLLEYERLTAKRCLY
ncbi:MAG: hypothetical protein Q9219_001908 [cf. Caloplaca sp. 3 TL-2023]